LSWSSSICSSIDDGGEVIIMESPPLIFIDSMMAEPPTAALASRRVAVLAADGVDTEQLDVMRRALEIEGALVNVVSNRRGPLQGLLGGQVSVDYHWLDMPSVMFDAVYIPGGAYSVAAVQADPDALHFTREAYEHGKSMAATGQGVELLEEVGVVLPTHVDGMSATGIVIDLHGQSLTRVADLFIAAIIKDRHWRRREGADGIAAKASAAPLCHQGAVGLGPI
jgi:catalase